MRRRYSFRVLCFCLALAPAWAFIQARTSGGAFLHRTDARGILFLINDKTAPGLKNTSGGVTITADSDPITALQAAMTTWSEVPTAAVSFVAPGSTSQDSPDPSPNPLQCFPDGKHIISFADTPANRTLVGDALAITSTCPSFSAEILDTDIFFSPTVTFSTTLQSGTYDIQSIATHELGHSLGAGHSGLLAATMYARTPSATNRQTVLTADDIGFVTQVYPANNLAASAFGSISGKVTLSGGGAVPGALVTAVDPSTSIAVGSITLSDGSYTIAMLPPGRYVVYAEPMDGPATPTDVGNYGTGANTAFSTVLSGADSPVPVSVGTTTTVNLTVTAGTPALNIQGSGSGPVGTNFRLTTGGFILHQGETVDVTVFGKGLADPSISESSISFLGASITVQAGSLGTGSVTLSGSNLPALIFTVQVDPAVPLGAATLLIRSSSSEVVLSAGAKILPPLPSFPSNGVVSAASYAFAGGAAVPGEIVSIFGVGMGPASGVQAGLDFITGRLSAQVAGVVVTFNGVRAPLYFVRQDQINAQVPFEMAGQSSANVIVSYQSVGSAPVAIPLGQARPGIFTKDSSGKGQGAILNQDGTVADSNHPASRGSVITVYATGQGEIQPPLATGELAPRSTLSVVTQAKSATMGGRPAALLFAGMAPDYAGLLQVNLAVPADAPVGPNVPVVLNIGGISSPGGVTIAVR
ncbi:MAG: carboxypeptidase regulatory-like domain-containing protein [Acidobacteria bacterium]|nr:carboxypeptidase regulatory-like domain-containing protein [Acidobacteriota bacterium]